MTHRLYNSTNKQHSNEEGHSENRHTLYIAIHVSSMQNKNDKTRSIKTECNFIIRIWKIFKDMFLLENQKIIQPKV